VEFTNYTQRSWVGEGDEDGAGWLRDDAPVVMASGHGSKKASGMMLQQRQCQLKALISDSHRGRQEAQREVTGEAGEQEEKCGTWGE
jgi:hypothetical protein